VDGARVGGSGKIIFIIEQQRKKYKVQFLPLIARSTTTTTTKLSNNSDTKKNETEKNNAIFFVS
jgi:hypothetical protein